MYDDGDDEVNDEDNDDDVDEVYDNDDTHTLPIYIKQLN